MRSLSAYVLVACIERGHVVPCTSMLYIMPADRRRAWETDMFTYMHHEATVL